MSRTASQASGTGIPAQPPGAITGSGYPGGAIRAPNVMGCKILIVAIRA